MKNLIKTKSIKSHGYHNLKVGDIVQVPMSNEWLVIVEVIESVDPKMPFLRTVRHGTTEEGPLLDGTGLYKYKLVIKE